jgi:site-specific DNA-cytosine methylase
MTPLVLSLFPGIGLLDMAFEEEGFIVVRGPDVLWGGDIRRFHPPAGKFDGVIGGPPCQSFSSLVHLVRANGHEPKFGNLIPEFERCVNEAQPPWFVMENVPQAPEPAIAGYGSKSFLLDNSALNGGDGFGLEQRRVRRFTFGMRGREEVPSLLRWIDLAVFMLPDADRSIITAGTGFPHGAARVNAVLGASSMNEGCLGATAATKARRKTLVSHPGLEVVGQFGKEKRQEIVAAKRVGPITGGHMNPQALTDRKRVKAVSGSNGGNGSERNTPGAGNAGKGRYRLADALRLQGLPEDFLDDAPFTADGKLKAVANGVRKPMGRAIARAVKEAIQA